MAAVLSSCAVAIKDETFYFDAGDSGAITVNFLTPGSTIVPKGDWDVMREGMVCMSNDSLADFKGEIEKLCSQTSCDYATTAAISDFFKRVEKLRNP